VIDPEGVVANVGDSGNEEQLDNKVNATKEEREIVKEERGENRGRGLAGFLKPAMALGASVVLALGVAACSSDDGGSGSDSGGTKSATLVLDFIPNAVHAGIYRAQAAGYYNDEGIDLRIIEPTSTADTLKLIDAGKADFGIADGIDLADQISSGRGAKGIMALTQKPSGGLITLTDDGFKSPADLDGKTVGVTGVPSDDAILETVMKGGGGNPDSVNKVTIGFNGVQNLENGKVNGFTGFYPADGVQVEYDGYPVTSFKFDENGGPRYPGLVAFTTTKRISSDSALMKAFVDATVRGYDDTLKDPNQSLQDLLAQNKSLKEGITKAQLEAYMPMFKSGAKSYGLINDANVEALSAYLVEKELIKQSIAPARYGTNDYVPGG